MAENEIGQIELRVGERRFTAFVCGDRSGIPVLCLHGFPDHARSFREQLPALAAAGYRAVSPMLRGYEPSSQGRRVVSEYHPLKAAADAAAWAEELGGGEPIHLIGHDWGGILADHLSVREPRLFRSITTLAAPPLHAMNAGVRRFPRQLVNSWYTLFFQLRGWADRRVARHDFAFIERLWRDWSPGWQWDPDDMAALKRTFRERDVLWCALAYYRAMLNPFLEDSKVMRAFSTRGTRIPMLGLTGELDGCMDTRIHDCADPRLFSNGFRVERISGAGHFLHQEKPDEVNRILLDWLDAH